MNVPNKSETGVARTCELCKACRATYTCPRCSISYCSIACYKSEAHIECSESFYKQCVEDELKSYENDPESKQSMIDILKRLHEQDLGNDILEDDEEEDDTQLDSDDDDSVPDLQERLRDVNLNNPDQIWSALTESERHEFQALVQNGEAEKLLPKWVPWWNYKHRKLMVQDIDSDQQDTDNLQKCPSLVEVPKFKDLVKAAPNVRFNLVNVIYAYVYIAHYFNGDYMDSAEEAVTIFLVICENMSQNKVFNDILTAEESVVQRIANSNALSKDNNILSTLREDVDAIVRGPGDHNKTMYLCAALSELYRLLKTAIESISTHKNVKSTSNFVKKFPQENSLNAALPSKKKLTLCLKKTEYYLSWVKCCFVQLSS